MHATNWNGLWQGVRISQKYFFSFLSAKIYMQFHINVEDATNNMDFRGQPGSRFCWCLSWEGCHCMRCNEILAWCPAESGSLFDPPLTISRYTWVSQSGNGWGGKGPLEITRSNPCSSRTPPSRVPSPRSRQLWDTPKLWGCCPWLVVLILRLVSTSQTPNPSP